LIESAPAQGASVAIKRGRSNRPRFFLREGLRERINFLCGRAAGRARRYFLRRWRRAPKAFSRAPEIP